MFSDVEVRKIILKNLFDNKDIMVYYHCYYVISKASEEKPELFYDYWNEFVLLLDHQNSYHRDIGLTIIANLTKIDTDDKFSVIYEKYIEHFNDAKFMTSECFVGNLSKIIRFKPQYEKRLVELLIGIDSICGYPIKQREVLKSYVIKLFDTIYEKSDYKRQNDDFYLRIKQIVLALKQERCLNNL